MISEIAAVQTTVVIVAELRDNVLFFSRKPQACFAAGDFHITAALIVCCYVWLFSLIIFFLYVQFFFLSDVFAVLW